MTIPKDKQAVFIEWFKEIAGPTFGKFGATKHEMFKVSDQQLISKQLTEENRFIERVYFKDNFDVASYFTKVKSDPEAWSLSRMYESEFGARDIELKVLEGIELR